MLPGGVACAPWSLPCISHSGSYVLRDVANVFQRCGRGGCGNVEGGALETCCMDSYPVSLLLGSVGKLV